MQQVVYTLILKDRTKIVKEDEACFGAFLRDPYKRLHIQSFDEIGAIYNKTLVDPDNKLTTDEIKEYLTYIKNSELGKYLPSKKSIITDGITLPSTLPWCLMIVIFSLQRGLWT